MCLYRKALRRTTLPLLLVLSACASQPETYQRWNNPNVDDKQFMVDIRECQLRGQQAGAGFNESVSHTFNRVIKQCMNQKGYLLLTFKYEHGTSMR
jgi:hypothetical protein